MSSSFETHGSTGTLGSYTVLKVFQQIGHEIRQTLDPKLMLQGASVAIGSSLELDRCVILLVNESDDQDTALEVAAEYSREKNSLGQRRYNLNPELLRLLQQGRPLPLKDLSIASSNSPIGDLEKFNAQCGGKSVIVFPLSGKEGVLGCLTMHKWQDNFVFGDELLGLGEALAEELAVAVERARALKEREIEGRVFRDIAMPALIIERNTKRIRKANSAAQASLQGSRKDLQGLPLTQVLPDGQRVLEAASELSKETTTITLNNILVGSTDGRPKHMDGCLSLLSGDDLFLLLHAPLSQPAAKGGGEGDVGRALRAEELANNLTKQLSWERWVRQLICKVHATLDRDTLLQAVVDGFGRSLGASRCLIVRTDGPSSPVVTHEYADVDISPLGLGRTGQFPTVAISYFKTRVAAIPDLSLLEKSGELTGVELDYFLDNGIRSMAGAPIVSHGYMFGVIIILESNAGRKWASHELDMLEIAANQTAVALGHSQTYLQLKDQIFNLNLLGNLTQQLTNTLEMLNRGGRPEAPESSARTSGNSPPLSLRELEVLKLIAAGLANREIAQRLFLTESTVELHASRIRKKLKLKSRTALVKYACDNGLA